MLAIWKLQAVITVRNFSHKATGTERNRLLGDLHRPLEVTCLHISHFTWNYPDDLVQTSWHKRWDHQEQRQYCRVLTLHTKSSKNHREASSLWSSTRYLVVNISDSHEGGKCSEVKRILHLTLLNLTDFVLLSLGWFQCFFYKVQWTMLKKLCADVDTAQIYFVLSNSCSIFI